LLTVFQESCEDPKGEYEYVVMDLIKDALTIESLVQTGSYTEEMVRSHMSKAIVAVQGVHSKRIVHGAISPSSFMVIFNDNPVENGKLKLIDFDTATQSKLL
jgi:serine/threonine protein kinase